MLWMESAFTRRSLVGCQTQSDDVVETSKPHPQGANSISRERVEWGSSPVLLDIDDLLRLLVREIAVRRDYWRV